MSVTTFSELSAWEQTVPPAEIKLIDFATLDNGAPITDPEADVLFELLVLQGVEFVDVRSLGNRVIYTYQNFEIKIDPNQDINAFFFDVWGWNTNLGEFTVSLSTGERFIFERGEDSQSFDQIGIVSAVPLDWITISFDLSYLILDNFRFVAANVAPEATSDAASVLEDGSVLGNVIDGSSGGADTDANGDVLFVSEVNGDAAAIGVSVSGQFGTLVLNADGSFSYLADADVVDTWAPGTVEEDVFTYTVSDGHGGTDTATLTITVSEAEDQFTTYGASKPDVLTGELSESEDVVYGGNGNDLVDGGGGADILFGGNGDDELLGGSGIDTLLGGNGKDILNGGAGRDRLDGGRGDDIMIGGLGEDVFVIAMSNGSDTIVDFQLGVDELELAGTAVRSVQDIDVDGDGIVDAAQLQLNSGSVALLGIAADAWTASSMSSA